MFGVGGEGRLPLVVVDITAVGIALLVRGSTPSIEAVALAYVVLSWLVLQVADLVLENIAAPGWVMQTIMLIVAIGFPLVLIFGWRYDITRTGIVRTVPHTGGREDRPLRPIGAGEDFYRGFAAELRAARKPVVIFSIADCLRPHLSPDFEVFHCDGHLTCFRRAGTAERSSAT